MLATTEKLLDKGFKDTVIKEWHFSAIFDGSSARKYALINKALKKGEILRLYRGTYILANKYRSENMSKFFVANKMLSRSYISFETALSYHGWIPERVNVVMNVIAEGRTRSFKTIFGEFEYIKIPINEYEFLTGVFRKELNNKPFLIAGPLRALADYVYIRKIEWSGLDFLLESLRIERESFETLTSQNFDELFPVYNSKRVLNFLENLRKALGK
jgi:hypothetical protein